jgi:hypothetical protein
MLFKRVIKTIHVLRGWVKGLAIFDVVDYDILSENQITWQYIYIEIL